MRNDPFGNAGQAQAGGRRGGGGGLFGNIRWWVLLAFGAYAAFYWFSNRVDDPYTGEKVLTDTSLTTEDEQALGLQAYQEILQQEQPEPANSPDSVRVRAIAERLVGKVRAVEDALAAEHGMQPNHVSDGFQWAVSVIPSQQVNAFCLPGGKMAVYTGLLPVAQTDDAVAVVMGHEIAHALLQHGKQRMAQQKIAQIGQMGAGMAGMDAGSQQAVMAAMGYGYLLPYARQHETQADEVGLMLAAAACFDPQAAIPLWQRMGEASGNDGGSEFASTHPNPGTRIQNLQALMPKALEYRAKFCR